MNNYRRARKLDGNQQEIATGLRAHGAWVWSTAGLGGGFPDLLVHFGGRFHLLEVKDGRKPPSGRKLTEAEAAFVGACPGPVPVVLCLEDALAAIGAKGRAA